MKKFQGRSFHDPSVTVHSKNCVVCDKTFTPTSGINKFCSGSCKGKWQYITGQVTTESQYDKISGNWKRYMSRLLYVGGRKRDGLTREQLLEKLEEQDYKCALSGISLTCQLKKGVKFPYNVSIDRIEAGGAYTIDNIQLICQSLNSFRNNTPLDEFIALCKAVADYNKEG